jgi:putative chitinase
LAVTLTAEAFRKLFSGVSDVERYADALNVATATNGVHTWQRLAAFLAQIGHESKGLTLLEENLHYSPTGLRATFGKYFPTQELADAYALRGAAAIASRVYANRMGNGDEASGDGYRYRGSTPIMLTGKDNYAEYGNKLGLPLMDKPDDAREIEVGMLVAGRFWRDKGCNQLADHDEFDAISDLINIGHRTERVGDSNGWSDRKARWIMARTVLGLAVNGLL